MIPTTISERVMFWRLTVGVTGERINALCPVTLPFLIDTVKDETATLVHCRVIIGEIRLSVYGWHGVLCSVSVWSIETPEPSPG